MAALWSREAIEAKHRGPASTRRCRLAKAVPVAWVYLTGWANGDGVANFRDDVYGIDTVGAAATEARVDPSLLPPTALDGRRAAHSSGGRDGVCNHPMR